VKEGPDTDAWLRSSLPEPFTVSLVLALAVGALPAALGIAAMLVAEAVDGCGSGDFGCWAYVVIGMFACPAGFVVGGVTGAVCGSRMTRPGAGYSGRDIWVKSFGLSVLLLVVVGPLSLAFVPLLF
jgi:hypothetical protein